MNAPVRVRRLYDSLLNLVSSMGTSKDKSAFNEYTLNLLDPAQLNSAYRGDWVARKVVNIPANDATREWRAWQADKKDIELIEGEEKRLDVQRKLNRAMICGRLYGGGLLVMGMGDDPSRELLPERVKKGGLKYLQWLSRYDVGASQIVSDVNSPYFGDPEFYEVRASDGSQVRVHCSRVVKFVGCEIVDRLTMSDGWGDSVLQAVDDAVKNVGLTSAGIATLVHELKIDVIKLPGLLEQVSTQEYRDILMSRFQLANMAKSTVNALLLDKEEEWERISASFAGVPDVLRIYLLVASGAADIPATRMIGQSAVGLGATGEGDLKNYYDMVAAEQKNELTPVLKRLDDVLVRSATGVRDETIHYDWRPLWQMSETQQAEIWVKKATVYQADAQTGTMDPDALAAARQNQLIEDGVYPGLEQILEEHGDAADLDEDDQQVRAQEEVRRSSVEDAKPRSLYVRRQLLNSGDLIAWARKQGFESTIPASEMHVTVAFSRDPVDWIRVGEEYPENERGEMRVAPGGPRLVERLGEAGDAVVLMFASSRLSWRHCQIRDAGASWDWPEYQPHVTVAYVSTGELDVSKMEPYRGELRFGPEIFEEVDEDWKARVVGSQQSTGEVDNG